MLIINHTRQQNKIKGSVRLQVLTAVTVNSTVFWDVTPYCLGDMYRRFGRNCCILPVDSPTQMIETVFSFEASVPFYFTTRVGTLIVATIYLQLIQNRYMFRSFTVLQCSHQHCVQPVASDVEVLGYL